MTVPDLSRSSPAPSLVSEAHHGQSRTLSWEDRSSWLDVAAVWKTSLSVLFHPSRTFAGLNYDAGIRGCLTYALVYGSLGQIIGRYWLTVAGILSGVLKGDALTNTVQFAEASLITPIALLVSLFFTAGLVHLILRLLVPGCRPFSATFQVMAYISAATSLLQVIPLLGNLLMPIWALVLSCIGLAAAHQTSKTRAFLALLLPFIVAGLFIAVVLFVLAAMGMLEFLQTIRQPL